MADLNDLESAATVKVVGATSSGVETNPVKVTSNQDMGTVDIANSSGVNGALNLSTSVIPIRVGASNLSNRKFLMIYNNSTHIIYWGFSSLTTVTSGIPLPPQSSITISAGESVTVYAIGTFNSINLRIAEGS